MWFPPIFGPFRTSADLDSAPVFAARAASDSCSAASTFTPGSRFLGDAPSYGYDGSMVLEALRSQRRAILDAAARHGARNVRVFGSTVRGDDGPRSDVDFLVDVEPGRSLLDVIALEQDLEELLGRRVEVLTDGGLNPYLQERILTEAQAL